jgi:hypothetical protein
MTLEEYANAPSGLSNQQFVTGTQLGRAWGGDPNQQTFPIEHVCPCCGYCPTCGRRGHGYVPNYPPPWPNYPQPYIGDPPNWMEWNKIYCGTTATTQCGNENKIY